MRKALTLFHRQPPTRKDSRAHPRAFRMNALLSLTLRDCLLVAIFPAFLLSCSKNADSASPPVQVQPSGPAQADVRATLSSLTQLVRKYTIENKRVPGSFDELVAAGYMTALPPAPPGQKFVINPKGVQVILMKQ
jgi:hypothetical protein